MLPLGAPSSPTHHPQPKQPALVWILCELIVGFRFLLFPSSANRNGRRLSRIPIVGVLCSPHFAPDHLLRVRCPLFFHLFALARRSPTDLGPPNDPPPP